MPTATTKTRRKTHSAKPQPPAPEAASVTEASAESDPAGIDPTVSDAAAPQLVIPSIPITALTAHPGNVRTDVTVSAGFVASVRAEGIRVPLLVTATDVPDMYRIIDGHKRLSAARKAGLDAVPCTFDATRADDEAGQYLDMLITSRHKTPLSPFEEAAALFSAEQAGASRTRLAKAYGKRTEVANALKIAKLPEATRAAAVKADYPWTIDELALLEEFTDDAEATERLISAAEDHSFGYQVERERIEREENQRREAIRAELTAAGVRVADAGPDGAVRLSRLVGSDGTDLTADSHAQCPGHMAVLERYGDPRASYYCEDPTANGHTDRWASTGDSGTTASSEADAKAEADRKAKATAKRRLVIRGNKDWRAAETNRRNWLTGMLTRTSLPREHIDMITRWTTHAYLTMPGPVSKRAGTGAISDLQAELLGIKVSPTIRPDWKEETDRASKTRLALLSLAPLAASYERNLTPETWRTDTDSWTQNERTHARVWLEFCQDLGHVLSPIEKAVLADVTYAPDDLAPKPTGEEIPDVSDLDQVDPVPASSGDATATCSQGDASDDIEGDPLNRPCEECGAEPGQNCGPLCTAPYGPGGPYEHGDPDDQDRTADETESEGGNAPAAPSGDGADESAPAGTDAL